MEITALGGTPREVREFVELQLRIYACEPRYVPPIVSERVQFLSPRHNPFFQHAEAQLFLARREGKAVGRIAAVKDRAYNTFHGSRIGFFGGFDCEDDLDAARALFEAAAAWLAARGLSQMLGPVTLSFNHESGVLVDGFEDPPAMMMPYNFPYYAALCEGAGLAKAKDLWSYQLPVIVSPPEKVIRVSERLGEEEKVQVRPLRLRELGRELQRVKAIYDASQDPAPEFAPMSQAEFDFMARRLRPLALLRPELCFFAEVDGEAVACSLTFPDFNFALKKAGGTLTRYGFPGGLLKMLWATQRIDRLRVLWMGVRPGYRRRGLDAVLALHTMRAARRMGYREWEIGWTAEDNDLINHWLEDFGARRHKVYRLYRRSLGPGTA
ncbi:MAG TPA: GNAT family N-acetyltransferase [Myxococcales bacterium]|nr:GNAT family N-acetyltransferase [Myxococcales bacterium]